MNKVFFATQFMPLFDYDACKSMYLKNQEKISDSSDFESVLSNSLFFSFYDNQGLIGCIYFYLKSDKLFCNAFARRKSHQMVLKCFDFSLKCFVCDIYAFSKNKPAVFVLLKSGFKKLGENLFFLPYNPNRTGAVQD